MNFLAPRPRESLKYALKLDGLTFFSYSKSHYFLFFSLLKVNLSPMITVPEPVIFRKQKRKMDLFTCTYGIGLRICHINFFFIADQNEIKLLSSIFI